MSILVIAEHDSSNLSAATLNTITAAKQIGSNIDLLVLGNNCQEIGKQASQIPNINSILVADAEEYKNFIAENASFQGYFTKVRFDSSEGNQLSYIQNGYFFKILR